jgi:hypothetical protein
MDVGSFFLIIVVLLLLVGGAIALTSSGLLGGARRSAPVNPDERPRHTRVDADQNADRERYGEPLDEAPGEPLRDADTASGKRR